MYDMYDMLYGILFNLWLESICVPITLSTVYWPLAYGSLNL